MIACKKLLKLSIIVLLLQCCSYTAIAWASGPNSFRTSSSIQDQALAQEKASSILANSFQPDSMSGKTTRRNALLVIGSATIWVGLPLPSNAGLFEETPKRQLELCIVSLLRIQFWIEKAVQDLQSESPDVRKQRYLEVRLASKALVTGKLGGGANYQVYTLNGLQLKGVLSDLAIYAQQQGGKSERRKVEDVSTELIESLASNVEFDGLETTLDPSPRSSLTMQMYNNNKAVFVKRTLAEKVLPDVKTLIRLFGSDVEQRCLDYVQKTYPNEIPVKPSEASTSTLS